MNKKESLQPQQTPQLEEAALEEQAAQPLQAITAFSVQSTGGLPDMTGQGKKYQEAPFSYKREVAESVILSGGTLRHTVTDFTLPGRNGFDLTVSRSYDSEQAGLGYYRTYWYTADNWTVCTYMYPNTHYPLLHGLGYGWYFNFPSIEALQDWVPDWAGNNYAQERYYLHLEDGRNIQIERKESTNLTIGKFKDYPLQDVVLTREEGTITHPYDAGKQYRYDVVVTYKNGNKDYFYHQRRCPSTDCWTHAIPLVARQDRFGNTIGITRHDYGGMEIVDSWGRCIVLAKSGNIMTWNLPDGNTIQYVIEGTHDLYRNDRVKSEIGTADVLRLARVTDQAGRVTSYNYHNINDYVMSGQFTHYSGGVSFPGLLLKTITHPTGAATEYEYGLGAIGQSLTLKLNSQGGLQRFYPLLSRKDVANGAVYNTVDYAYTLAESNGVGYIGHTQVTRMNGVVEKHTFSDKGLLTEKETRHHGALVFSGSYTYGTDANAANYRLPVSEKIKKYSLSNGNFIEKHTDWQYSADKKGNPTKIVVTCPQDGELNQETDIQYGSYSQETERSCRKDSDTLLVVRNTLRTAPDDKVVEYSRVCEKTGGSETLREKTRFLYGAGFDDNYCVVQEQRFYTGENGDLESSGQYRATHFAYSAAQRCHQPIAVRTSGLTDADGGALADVNQAYSYDAMGRCVSATDGLGNTTNTTYDALGRPVLEQYPAVDGVRHSVSTYYNDTQNYITQTDENGYKTRTTYTALGDLSKKELAVDNTPAGGDVLLETYAYDASQRLVQEQKYGPGNGSGSLLSAVQRNILTKVRDEAQKFVMQNAQLSNGALTVYTRERSNDVDVTPYFASSACLNLLNMPGNRLYSQRQNAEMVKKYINWHFARINTGDEVINAIDHRQNPASPPCHAPAGSIFDYSYQNGVEQLRYDVRGTAEYNIYYYDSTDSYAAVFLSLLKVFCASAAVTDQDKDEVFTPENLEKMARIIEVMGSTFDPATNLTTAFDQYAIEYLMDNCEVYQGYLDAAWLLDNVMGGTAQLVLPEKANADPGNVRTADLLTMAGLILNGIIGMLGNAPNGQFYPYIAKGGTPAFFGNGKFYPDAAAQAFPVVFDILDINDPTEKAKAEVLYSSVQTQFLKWASFEFNDPQEEYPMSLTAYGAYKMGKVDTVVDFLGHFNNKYIENKNGYLTSHDASVVMLLANQLLEDALYAPIPVSEVSLSDTSVVMHENDVHYLTATVLPGRASNRKIVWTSNNTGVATVNSSGIVTACGLGTARITAKSAANGSKYAVCTIVVNPPDDPDAL